MARKSKAKITSAPAGIQSEPREPLHWQLLPPLLLLYPFWTDKGPDFLLAATLMVPIAIYSAISLAWKLWPGRRVWYRAIRPAFTLALVLGAQQYAIWSVRDVMSVADKRTAILQSQCQQNSRCPETLGAGSPGEDGLARLSSPSSHLRWPADYQRTDQAFVLHINFIAGRGAHWSGGTGSGTGSGSLPR